MALCVCVCVCGGGGGVTHTHTPTHFARTQGSLPYLVHCNCFVAYTRRLHCIIDLCRYTPLNGSIEHMPPPPPSVSDTPYAAHGGWKVFFMQRGQCGHFCTVCACMGTCGWLGVCVCVHVRMRTSVGLALQQHTSDCFFFEAANLPCPTCTLNGAARFQASKIHGWYTESEIW
eukprot:jgi/Botrbrau1/10154/Bobra.0121s0006.1